MKKNRFKKLKKSLSQAIQHARITTELSDRDRDKFLELIKRDEPNDNLRKAFRRCHELFGENDV